MEEYGRNKKRVVMKCYDHTHAKLLVKLKEYKIKQHDFFMEFIDGFVNDDPIIHQWIESNDKIKIKKRSTRIRKRENRNIQKVEKEFNFDQEEIDGIFDILEDLDVNKL